MTHVSITEHTVAGRDAGPYAITTGPDGALWFTEWGMGRVGAIAGDGTEVYGLPTPGCEPHGITLGPDGALWTALEIGALARIAPARGQS